MALRVYSDIHCCILGDFNSIRGRLKRKRLGAAREWLEDSRVFNTFIENSSLIDFPLLERKFT
jgi:hypothetical protein